MRGIGKCSQAGSILCNKTARKSLHVNDEWMQRLSHIDNNRDTCFKCSGNACGEPGSQLI